MLLLESGCRAVPKPVRVNFMSCARCIYCFSQQARQEYRYDFHAASFLELWPTGEMEIILFNLLSNAINLRHWRTGP